MASFELAIRNAQTRGGTELTDIGITAGRIAAIQPRLGPASRDVDDLLEAFRHHGPPHAVISRGQITSGPRDSTA
ncbi:MAG: hypothetical protein ACRDF6_02985 [bacterium]